MYELELVTLSFAVPVLFGVGFLHGEDHVTPRIIKFFIFLGIAVILGIAPLSVVVAIALGIAQTSGSEFTHEYVQKPTTVTQKIKFQVGARLEPVELTTEMKTGEIVWRIRQAPAEPLAGKIPPIATANIVTCAVIAAVVWSYVLGYYIASYLNPPPEVKVEGVEGIVEIDPDAGIITPLQGRKPIASTAQPPKVVNAEQYEEPKPAKIRAVIRRRSKPKPASVGEILWRNQYR